MTGADMIASERKRQIEVEGWTAEHDAHHDGHELALAAVAYTQEAIARCGNWVNFYRHDSHNPPSEWPWAPEWWKPSDDPIRNLVKAGALIAAEIDRLSAEARVSVANRQPERIT